MKKIKKFKALVLELDKIFSAFIRERDSFRHGRCVICGIRPIEVCFHFLSRGDMGTRWEPDNCVGSCKGCNMNEYLDRRQNNKDRFEEKHIELVGEKRVLELKEKARAIAKFSRDEIESLIEIYRAKQDSVVRMSRI